METIELRILVSPEFLRALRRQYPGINLQRWARMVIESAMDDLMVSEEGPSCRLHNEDDT